MNNAHKLTILVPTRNRFEYLRRLIHYYGKTAINAPLIILDSSENPISPADVRILSADTTVTYKNYPADMPVDQKIVAGLVQVETPYVLIWADDDFMVPRAIEHGLDFLERNDDFCAVHGLSGVFRVASEHSRKFIAGVGPYKQRSIISPRPSARYLSLMSDYSTSYYSLQRTHNTLYNFKTCSSLNLDYSYSELLLAGLSAIQGKSMSLDRLYMMRESHQEQTSVTNKYDCFDWVTSNIFPNQYAQYHETLTRALMRNEKLDREVAGRIIKRGFWKYISLSLTSRWRHADIPSERIEHPLKQTLRRIPGLVRIRNIIRAFTHRKEILLPTLLSSLSPFHSDFMPIYEAVHIDAPARD